MDKKENTETTAGSLVPFPPGKIIVPSQFEGSSFVEGTGTSGVTPMFYWRALVRNKWYVVLGTLAGIAVAVLFLILVKPVYRAKSTIEVLSMNQDFMNMKQTDPVMAPPFSDEVSEEQTQSQLFFSEALLARVRNKFDPNRPAVPFHPPQSTWQTFLGTSNKPPLTPREKLLDAAVKSMNVVVLPRTRLLEVSADSKDPQFAADFVKTLVDQFVRGNVEAHLNTTQNTSNWLSGELNDARSNLQHSEDALQAYARSSGLLFTDSGSQQQTTVVSEKLQGIERSLSAATADRIAKQSRYEVAAHSPADSLADVLNDLGLQALKQKIDDAGRQVAQLNAIYNADYSKVKRAKAELAALQNAFQTARASIISRIKTDYNQAQRNERLLMQAYVAAERDLAGEGEKAVQYNILKREVDSNRQLYDAMLQQMKQASLATALHASTVRVVDGATLQDAPVFPKKLFTLVIGACLGLFGSIFASIVRERMNRTVQIPGDVSHWTGLRELGAIPMAAPPRSPLPFAKPSRARVDPLAWNESSSLIADSVRSTLASIMFSWEGSSSPRVLVVTSSREGEGKTTVLSNIGMALAEINCRTLIIDADLRCPRMHKVFDRPNENGLSSLLNTDFREQDLRNLIQPTSVSGLDVLTAGESSSTNSYLFHSPTLPKLLEMVKRDYRIVLIDTPPLLYTSDARVIARLADATILIARAGKTSRDALLTARQRLEDDGIRILGSVLNDWDPKSSDPDYYKGYRSYLRAKSVAANAS